MQDPTSYLDTLGVSVPSALDPDRTATLHASTVSRVNHEVFLFHDTGEKRRFEADPLAHCGLLSDPVSRQRFQPTAASPRESAHGVNFYFISEETRDMFAAHPDSFAVPRLAMVPKPEDES